MFFLFILFLAGSSFLRLRSRSLHLTNRSCHRFLFFFPILFPVLFRPLIGIIFPILGNSRFFHLIFKLFRIDRILFLVLPVFLNYKFVLLFDFFSRHYFFFGRQFNWFRLLRSRFNRGLGRISRVFIFYWKFIIFDCSFVSHYYLKAEPFSLWSGYLLIPFHNRNNDNKTWKQSQCIFCETYLFHVFLNFV